MQKINYLLPLLLLSSFYAQAVTGTQASGDITSAEPAAAEALAAALNDDSQQQLLPASNGQEQIVHALQDDIVFERQKRQLSNELALEKLRSELQKVRDEQRPSFRDDGGATMPAQMPDGDNPPSVSYGAAPSVVLVSQVAGVSRVAVSVNGELRFFSPRETISANGKQYRLVPVKNGLLTVREIR